MSNLSFRNELKRNQIDLKEFLTLFITLALLAVFAILRFGYAQKMETREKTRQQVATILRLEKQFHKANGRYGTLAEIGFVNPFPNNSVDFLISIDKDLVVQARENPLYDAFGDKSAGNEYFIGYTSGNIEYNKTH